MKGVTFYGFTADTAAPEAVRRFVEKFGVEPAALWVHSGAEVAPVGGLPVVAHEDVPGFAIYLALPLSAAQGKAG